VDGEASMFAAFVGRYPPRGMWCSSVGIWCNGVGQDEELQEKCSDATRHKVEVLVDAASMAVSRHSKFDSACIFIRVRAAVQAMHRLSFSKLVQHLEHEHISLVGQLGSTLNSAKNPSPREDCRNDRLKRDPFSRRTSELRKGSVLAVL
jgi:hypothetical protein